MSFRGLYEDLPPPSILVASASPTTGNSTNAGKANASVPQSSTPTPNAVIASAPSVLYPSEEKTSGAWSNAASKFIPPTAAALARKKQLNAMNKPKKAPKPVVVASASAVVLQPSPPIPQPKSTAPPIPAKIASEDIIFDEYDPARPNDYEDYCQEREARAFYGEPDSGSAQRSSNSSQAPIAVPGSAPSGSFAERMMKKMGWVEGQGLGKSQQGITSPLLAKKTTGRGGIIVGPKNEKEEGPPHKKQRGNFSRVVLLRNMVGAGEADEELEEETKEECVNKYGEVESVSIFEVSGPTVPDDQAVRIFVCFKRTESAVKAITDLNGRYFGGRAVNATFYDLDKYQHQELGPEYDSD